VCIQITGKGLFVDSVYVYHIGGSPYYGHYRMFSSNGRILLVNVPMPKIVLRMCLC
jgi:hypothetical protein